MQPNLGPGEDFQLLLERQVREMQSKAAALNEALSAAGATVRTRDGSVTVTLAPNGALTNLELGHRACELGPARLTAAIMGAVRDAQRQTARAVADSFATINGDGESTAMVRSFLPPDPPPDGDFAAPENAEPTPPPPAVPPSPPSAPRRRPAADDRSDDESNPW
ncbi:MULTISPECIES: YbaB/EbfC family nucleoid-associated protein [unclassified Amycolatopsis]|uniref:YbaB/EbfC family nucleoid-associated protein n=1 Tax=unclassified Amycolatopsis TaxID=2618356 RepID=UPI00287647DA|nr:MULTISPECIES: YbaB/EbfC family nucleoid-associated protein [unclassified Amycolatopsis]MDS0135666.1 YbaB/EbfC family nucleoid-associated protein [Amycolatopsis sp. 505]MDS0148318.1 YbaB/EbfC family nucleoid-associated protein [Amycolatopsis sp. CM201R]